MYRKSVLRNGVRVVSHPMSDRDSISLGILCGVGGRFEDDDVKGAAHFLEHIVFKGTKKYSCEQIKERVEGVGGTLNAFTSEEQTCYFAKIPSRYLNRAFDVLADMVFFPQIAPKDVASERGVILEEIKMYYDLPQYFVMEELERLMWPDHPLGKGLAGTLKSVSGITAKELKRFHMEHYVPNNVVVAACGNLTHEVIVDLVRKKTSSFLLGERLAAETVVLRQQNPKAVFYHRPIEQMHLAFGVHALDSFHDDRYALTLLNVILGGNMSSRLFNEIREKRGLAYSVHSSIKLLNDTGMFLVRAGVDNRKLTQAVKVLLDELRKICCVEVSKSEFTRAKEYVLGQLLLSLEDTAEHMLWIGESTVVRDRIRTVDEVVRAIKKLKIADIQRVASMIFDPKCFNLSVVGPIQADQEKQIRSLLKVSE